MQISLGKPPIYNEAAKAFTLTGAEVFTYGDTLYNPGHGEIQDHLLVHEEVHATQQNHNDADAAIWWKRYFEDVNFRVDQEVEAYGAQYKFICKKVKDRNQRSKYLFLMAQHLSSPMYGSVITHSEAVKAIRIQS